MEDCRWIVLTYNKLGDGDGEAELTANTDTESDGLLSLSRGVALGASALGEVSLEVRAEGVLAEAVEHVGLLALQRGVLSDDALEAVDLLKKSVLANLYPSVFPSRSGSLP